VSSYFNRDWFGIQREGCNNRIIKAEDLDKKKVEVSVLETSAYKASGYS
jgi:hypothetical protein